MSSSTLKIKTNSKKKIIPQFLNSQTKNNYINKITLNSPKYTNNFLYPKDQGMKSPTLSSNSKRLPR